MAAETKECYVCAEGNYKPWEIGKKLCEAHDVCIDCGIKRKELADSPWGVRIGAFQCKPCEEKERLMRIKDRMEKGFEHEYEDEIVCPNCGYEFSDCNEYGEGEQHCDECKKPFEMERHVSVSYSTKKIEESP